MSTYTLYVGSTPGAYDIAAFQTSNLSLTVSNIPTDGRTLYVTLYGNGGGVRTQQDTATYTAANIVKAVITGPTKGSHLYRQHGDLHLDSRKPAAILRTASIGCT